MPLLYVQASAVFSPFSTTIMATSGYLGEPKGMPLFRAQMLSNYMNIQVSSGLRY